MTTEELKKVTEGSIARFHDGRVTYTNAPSPSTQFDPTQDTLTAQFETAYHTARLADAQEDTVKAIRQLEFSLQSNFIALGEKVETGQINSAKSFLEVRDLLVLAWERQASQTIETLKLVGDFAHAATKNLENKT